MDKKQGLRIGVVITVRIAHRPDFSLELIYFVLGGRGGWGRGGDVYPADDVAKCSRASEIQSLFMSLLGADMLTAGQEDRATVLYNETVRPWSL